MKYTAWAKALITAHIHCGIHLVTSLCNVTRFIFVQCCIHLSARSRLDDESDQWAKIPQHVPKILNGDKVWLMTNPCVKMLSRAPLSQFNPHLNPMNPCIVILEYALAIRKENRWNNLVIQFLQVVSCPHSFGT